MAARLALVACVVLCVLGVAYAMRRRSPLNLFTLFTVASGMVIPS